MADNLFKRFIQAAGDQERILLQPLSRDPISFRQTFEIAGRFATVLASHGVQPGDRVAVQVEKSPEALILYLACLRCGAVYLPLNSSYTASELAYFISDAEPRLLICSEAKRETIVAALPGTELLTLGDDGRSGSLSREATSAPSGFADVNLSMNDLASILYTSGTTGRSKGAMLTHGNLLSNADSLRATWRFSQKDMLLHALPIFHTHGLFVATNVTMLSGAGIILLPKFDLNTLFASLPGATVMMGVPTFYTRMLQDRRLTRDATRHVRLFISGSAPLLTETHRLWSERTGHAILERYGMTETNMITSNPYDGIRVPGSVGMPLSGVEVRITGREGETVPLGEVGMIEVRGPNVFKGYWRMPEKTAAEFRSDGFFVTGDLGKVDERGYVHIVGRDKDLIISGGFNVYPKEVENLIDELPGVEESAVVGIAHADFGEGVTAFVVRKRGGNTTEKEIMDALDGRLARFKHPKCVVFLEQLPRNTMGKIQKSLIREIYNNLYD